MHIKANPQKGAQFKKGHFIGQNIDLSFIIHGNVYIENNYWYLQMIDYVLMFLDSYKTIPLLYICIHIKYV